VQNFVLVVGGFVIVGEEGWQRLVAFAVRRRLVLLDQAQRFGQPAAIGEQTFGLPPLT
jgi:hypothetical protein